MISIFSHQNIFIKNLNYFKDLLNEKTYKEVFSEKSSLRKLLCKSSHSEGYNSKTQYGFFV